MKRYSFNLEPVLRARRLQQDMAKSELLKANMAAQAAELAVGSSFAHYEALTRTPPSATSFATDRYRSELAADALVGARRSLTVARVAVDQAMQEYIHATKTVSVLERLEERRREEHAAEAAHEEAGAIDDIVTARHAARRARDKAGKGK